MEILLFFQASTAGNDDWRRTEIGLTFLSLHALKDFSLGRSSQFDRKPDNLSVPSRLDLVSRKCPGGRRCNIRRFPSKHRFHIHFCVEDWARQNETVAFLFVFNTARDQGPAKRNGEPWREVHTLGRMAD